MRKLKKTISSLAALSMLASVFCWTGVSAASELGTIEATHTSKASYSISAPATSGESYKFYAASFNNAGRFIGLEEQPVTASSDTVSADFDLTNASYITNVKETRFMLWGANGVIPQTTVRSVDFTEGMTEVASGKTTGGNGSASNGLHSKSENAPSHGAQLVDGNDDSTVGFFGDNFGDTGYMYIDLGTAYKIDHIDVLAYDAASYHRGGQFDVVVGNAAPTGQAAQTGDVTVATAADDNNATSKAVGYKHYFLSGSGEYRFVSLKKYGGEHGIMAAEVKVYVKTADMPTFTEVAQGKQTGGGYDGTPAYNFTQNPTSNMVDGNETTGAGYYFYSGHRDQPLQGYMYIDLRQPYKIDHIEIVSYDNVRPTNANGFNLIATNTEPDSTPYNSSSPGYDLLVASVPSDGNQRTIDVGRNTYYMPGGSGSYRYVSLEKFNNTVADTGMFIQEVKVYVKDSDMPAPITYTEVAHGKSAGGSTISGGGLNGGAAANLVDGNETNNSGFYYSAGNYQGYLYIDLGLAYKIDHIEVLAYNQYRPFVTGGYDVIVGNKLPDTTPYDGTGGEVRIAANVAQHNVSGEYRTFEVPAAQSGSYRYVSFEKLQSQEEGMLLSEVKVYVKDSDMPVNVALGKNSTLSRGAVSGFGDTSVITDGQYFAGGNSKQVITYLSAWCCLDLEDTYSINDVFVDAVDTKYSSQVSIYLSNDPATPEQGLPASKICIVDGTADPGEWSGAVRQKTLATPVNARYVIVYRPAGASENNLRIGEIKVFGTPVSQ